MKRKYSCKVEYVVVVGKMERELTLAWLIPTEGTPLF